MKLYILASILLLTSLAFSASCCNLGTCITSCSNTGNCSYTCNSGYYDTDLNNVNGCESTTLSYHYTFQRYTFNLSSYTWAQVTQLQFCWEGKYNSTGGSAGGNLLWYNITSASWVSWQALTNNSEATNCAVFSGSNLTSVYNATGTWVQFAVRGNQSRTGHVLNIYSDYTYLNVTYSTTIFNPTIIVAWNAPTNNTWNTSQTITHGYTPTWYDSTPTSCSLWTNKSGSFALAASNATPLSNATQNTISFNYGLDSALIYAYINCTNSSGSSNYTSNYTVKIDTAKPTTSASAVKSDSAPYTFDTWTNSSYVTVTLTCSDTTSGCSSIEYCKDQSNICTPSLTYSSPFIVNTQGESYVRYRSTDAATNTETTHYQVIQIDTAAPSTTATAVKNDSSSYTFNSWTNSTYVNVTLTCSDSSSGCNSTKYCTDATNTCTPDTAYSSAVSISTEGTSYIRYNSTDNVSNNEAVKSQTIKVDLTPPTQPTLSTLTKGATWINLSIGACTDSGSGVNQSLLYRNGTNIQNFSGGSATTYNDTGLAPGTTYAYNLSCMDNVSRYSTNATNTETTLNFIILITQNGPADSSTNSSRTINFTYTPVWYNSAMANCSIWDNSTGSWAMLNNNGTQVLTNSSVNNITHTYTADYAQLKWAVQCCNTTSSCNMTDNWTLAISTAVSPSLTTATDYPNCGAVFYKVRLYDSNSKLINSYFLLKVIDPDSVTNLTQTGCYPNNGTGVYIGNYSVNTTATLGTWLLKITENSGVSAGKNFYIVPKCGDSACSGGENYGNCPADCVSYCGDTYCDGSTEDCSCSDCPCTPPTGCINCPSGHTCALPGNCPE